METSIFKENNTFTAMLSGRLDTLASPAFERDIAPLKENADKAIVLDCKELEYISSSGLRVFLSLLKTVKAAGGSLTIRNINNEIRNIFTITGFQKIFNIAD